MTLFLPNPAALARAAAAAQAIPAAVPPPAARALSAAGARAPRRAPGGAELARAGSALRVRGATAYLVLAAVLAPLCVPAGPAQSAAIDLVNVLALAGFGLVLLAPGARPVGADADPRAAALSLRAPLILPMARIALGSLLATTGAPSVGLAALALLQDVYLFTWFLLVVNLLRDPAELRAVRLAWTATATAVALGAIAQVLFATHGSLLTLLGARGLRPASTLYNPNMLADYLVLSVFVTLSLVHELPRPAWAAALGAMLVGLLATKSNGGWIALLAGATVWVVVRAVVEGRTLRRIVAVAALLAGVLGTAAWLEMEWGVADAPLRALTRNTFMGRIEHSSASRRHIWDQLEHTYARSPLGIGPGNSGALTLSIEERERPDSYRSKEAHSDYLAYAIERGPLGLVGLLCMTLGGFMHVVRHRWSTRLAAAGAGDRTAARRAGLWTASMAAALAASAVHSTVIEKLHFRHFWLLLALVCGSSLLAAERAARASGEPLHAGAALPEVQP